MGLALLHGNPIFKNADCGLPTDDEQSPDRKKNRRRGYLTEEKVSEIRLATLMFDRRLKEDNKNGQQAKEQ
jgi:hypothetical protein